MIGGTLFVCVPSLSRDTHEFLPAAKAAGAVAAIVHSQAGFDEARRLGLAAALIPTDVWDDSIWRFARAAFDDPSKRMRLIGITGTNGKTTTAWLVRDLLVALGEPCGYLGTLGFQTPLGSRELANTTPFPIDLYRMLDEAAESCQALAMEVSSHALAQHRADGLSFEVVAFTNFTQDHLDFHGSMEEYEAAKWRLFTEFQSNSRVINIADPIGAQWSHGVPSKPFAVGIPVRGGVQGFADEVGLTQIKMRFREGAEWAAARIPLGGAYNVENALAAYTIVREMGYSKGDVCAAFPKVRPVPGRFEPVPNEAGIGIIVDYAHTPDALDKLLSTARPLVSGRIITVFGCGGDRDRAKRPLMAAAAARGSNFVVATSDNPRTEDPAAILAEVVAGIPGDVPYEAVLDRGEAVARAIALAKPGDAVIVAGKGHENYQIIGKTKFPMDDRELARDGLAARG